MSKKVNPNRRTFIQASAVAGAGFWAAGGVAPKKSLAAIEEIRFACVGVGGKGSSDSDDAGRAGKVVGICDIDDETLNKAGDKFPGAKKYHDYRKMFEELGDSIDAVTVSTPDHTHAVAAAQAMKMGKACFCQKPLTRSLWEARQLSEIAKKMNVATQMGNQGTAESNLRKSAALIGKKKVVGTVKEIHVWTNRPVWPQAYGLKVATMAPPAHIKWDLWLGPNKHHEYSPEIHPFKWRGFWEFGTGALGDMACHTLNMSYMALNLRDPISVEAEADRHDGICFPKWSKITFEFPELDGRAACKMVWYDGGQVPPAELMKDLPKQGDEHFTSGALVIGDKGMFYSPGDYGEHVRQTGVIANGEFTPIRSLECDDWVRSPGHFVEFAEAIKGGPAAMSNIQTYAGGLTETILLGNLAVWSGKKVEWDAKNLVSKNVPGLEQVIRPEMHNGYEI
ncbi:MAG: Gfo/Idh/MocA family oxidoreductase [Planctomycetaceae bacterium]|nr:Gfo/Idh/MocA family oxidoreductase [Planctomycetaceae bacterium]